MVIELPSLYSIVIKQEKEKLLQCVEGRLSMGKWKNLFEKSSFRKPFLLFFQIDIILSAFLIAFAVRFDGDIPTHYWQVFLKLLPVIIVIKTLVFWKFGMFTGWWRFVSLPDMMVILKGNIIASTAFIIYAALAFRLENMPRSILILDGLFCFLIMSGVRVFTRLFRENLTLNFQEKNARMQRVLIVGAGAAGQTIVREIRQNPHMNKTVLGFIDNDKERQQLGFMGVSVLGTTRELAAICSERKIDMVIVASSSVCRKELRKIVDVCRKAKVESKILPNMGDIINGEISVQNLRNVQLEDLLGRCPVRLDIEGIKEFLEGKRILVTGAAGSIGSEICRQAARFSPHSLVLFDNAETPLFFIENELKKQFQRIDITASLNDIRDRAAVEQVFRCLRPEVVFHTAAYKHVPLSESNPVEVLGNNVLGTKNIADAADAFGVKHFVMVSTDKAVNPTNIMGASKRAAEMYVQNLSRKSKTKLVTVRFGNVLGSNGSVIPIFREQIQKGGPITVTHPEVTRFFMTIPEASQLVLQAGSMGKGGEIFLLDMGEPVKIVSLARELIRLSGLKENEDIDIIFTGLRPGEKLYEELLLAGEGVCKTRHEKICVAQALHIDSTILDKQIEVLRHATRVKDSEAVLSILRDIVPEYQPQQKDPAPKMRFKSPQAPPVRHHFPAGFSPLYGKEG